MVNESGWKSLLAKLDLTDTSEKLATVRSSLSYYTLSKKIRKTELGKEATHIPIIAFTTHDPKVVADSCKSFGIDAVMRSDDLNLKVIRQITDVYVDGNDIAIPELLKTSDYNFAKTLEKKS